MENNLLSIGEMAKSRNVNVQSLRYYEKLGILLPVYINPETGYRYYAPEQIMVLDTIILCIHLGIPLKDLKNYVNADGQLEFEQLLKYGRELATEKILKIETGLASIDSTLQQINAQKKFFGQKGYYSRTIQKRRCLCISCVPKMAADVYEKMLSKLFHMADSLSLQASFPHGIISDYHYGKWTGSRMFLEVMPCSAEQIQTVQGMETDTKSMPYSAKQIQTEQGVEKDTEVMPCTAKQVEVLQEGSYLCFQEPREKHSAPEDIFPEISERENASVIVSCMSPNTYKYDEVTLEFQLQE